MKVRTRVAPSPTGDPHVGTAYVALFNMCFAQANGGQFILRVEDTDRARSTEASESAIINSLRWLGLDWDEGPDNGGDFGPYRQSERLDIYREYAEQLVTSGKAFVCYRTPDELNQIREERRTDGKTSALKQTDLMLPDDEIQRRKEAGAASVIRMMVPEGEGSCLIDDMLRGQIELDWSMVDAQILIKSDGAPTYHLANVVDDHLMEITHVIRGEEWINSAPKHQLLYQYFGWDMPILCHLPLLRNPDKSKLSKRKNPTSILYYERMGYLPEALINYLARMGWSMPDEREKFTLQEMIDEFEIDRISLGGPIFDLEKLSWLNGMWIRENLSESELADRLIQWAYNQSNLMKVLPHVQKRMETLSDFVDLTSFLVSGELSISKDDFSDLKTDLADSIRYFQFVLWRLETLDEWSRETIWESLKALSDALEIKIKDFLAPFFIAISGSSASFSVVDAMGLLGAEMTKARIRYAIQVLGGVSKKEAKRLEKEYSRVVNS